MSEQQADLSANAKVKMDGILELAERAKRADSERYGDGVPRWAAMADFAITENASLLAALRESREILKTSIMHFDKHNCPRDIDSDEPCDICAIQRMWTKQVEKADEFLPKEKP